MYSMNNHVSNSNSSNSNSNKHEPTTIMPLEYHSLAAYNPATNIMINTNQRVSLQQQVDSADSAAANNTMDDDRATATATATATTNIPSQRRRSNTMISDVSDVMTIPTTITCSSNSISVGSNASTTATTYNNSKEEYFASTETDLDATIPSIQASSTLLSASSSASAYGMNSNNNNQTKTNSTTTTTFDNNHEFLLKDDFTNNNNPLNNNTQTQELHHHHHHHHDRHPERERMKRNRRDKTATYGVGGAVVGTMIFPVVGTIVGGAISGYSTNLYMKRNEKRIQQRWERDQYQRHANESLAATNAVFV